MIFLKQSTSVVIPFGPAVANTDAVTLVTNLVGTTAGLFENITTGIQITKNGATSIARAATATASVLLTYGHYAVTLATTDTNTLGTLRVAYSAPATVCPIWVDCMVMPANMWNSLFGTGGSIPDAVAGASAGILISGSNSGTTTLQALTVTGATTYTGATVHTGNVSYVDGITVAAPSTGNRAGIDVTGNGTGAGLLVTGGSTGDGLKSVGGASGHGFTSQGTGTTKHGINAIGGATTSAGIAATGGGTSGDGIKVVTVSGHGINLAPVGTNMHGILSTGGNGGTSDGIKAAAGTGGVDIRGNITGNLVGTVSTLTTYTGNTPQTGDSFARIGATGSGLTTLATAAQATAIQADTDDIQTRIPAALTAGGFIKADSLAISGDSIAADTLEAIMDGTIVGQVNDAAATTTSFIASGFTEATNDHFKGRLITFLTGAMLGQQTDITAYTGATQTFTVTAMTEAPANSVFFTIT